MKYIAVTGGVVSGLGKGITISSIGAILKSCGYRVTAIKIDPYLVRVVTRCAGGSRRAARFPGSFRRAELGCGDDVAL